ncbi:MAG: GTPase Era [Steroidobacteraceae bacterium]|nr:GTPase Era [Steroidobacteraceae bacterium]MCC7197922.1 GTPase Era [Gammaproteobacteria bacterium]
MSEAHRAGFVALVGRPNVGKSTLLNALVGQKVSIVTPKPQTTRHRILGVVTGEGWQASFLDTPGLHGNARRQLNRAMNRAALGSLAEAHVAVLVVDGDRWTDEDETALARVKDSGIPAVLVINKVDRVRPRERLLPVIERLSKLHDFIAVVPLSARREQNLAPLLAAISAALPECEAIYPEDQVTDRSERFLAAEVIREKLTLAVHEELPYGISVEIERWEEQEDGRLALNAIIWVERDGQKKIVIGEGGARLKSVGRAARLELNELLGRRVHLELWVKVREDWADNEAALRQFGYDGT